MEFQFWIFHSQLVSVVDGALEWASHAGLCDTIRWPDRNTHSPRNGEFLGQHAAFRHPVPGSDECHCGEHHCGDGSPGLRRHAHWQLAPSWPQRRRETARQYRAGDSHSSSNALPGRAHQRSRQVCHHPPPQIRAIMSHMVTHTVTELTRIHLWRFCTGWGFVGYLWIGQTHHEGAYTSRFNVDVANIYNPLWKVLVTEFARKFIARVMIEQFLIDRPMSLRAHFKKSIYYIWETCTHVFHQWIYILG